MRSTRVTLFRLLWLMYHNSTLIDNILMLVVGQVDLAQLTWLSH
jgi:hypothetical protein